MKLATLYIVSILALIALPACELVLAQANQAAPASPTSTAPASPEPGDCTWNAAEVKETTEPRCPAGTFMIGGQLAMRAEDDQPDEEELLSTAGGERITVRLHCAPVRCARD